MMFELLSFLVPGLKLTFLPETVYYVVLVKKHAPFIRPVLEVVI